MKCTTMLWAKWAVLRASSRSADEEEESKLDDVEIDAEIAAYRQHRRPSVEQLAEGARTLRPTFQSLPEPRRGHSPPATSVRYPSYSVSYGSIDDGDGDSFAGSSGGSRGGELNNSTVTCLNLICHLMGIGLLALPWAFVNLGWSAIIICFLFGAIHAATAVLLGKCQRSIPGLPRSFQEVADVAFGLRGRNVVAVFFYLVILCDLVVSLHLFSVTVASLLGRGQDWVEVSILSTGIFCLLANVLLLTETKRWLGVVGGIASLLLTFLFIFDLAQQASEVCRVPSAVPRKWFNGPASIVQTFGVFSFCFSGHLAVPSLTSKMRHPAQYSFVICLAFGVATLCYCAVGCLGLVISPIGAFGQGFVYLFLQNKGLPVWDMGVRFILSIVIMAKAPLSLAPLVDAAVEVVRPRVVACLEPPSSRSTDSPPPSPSPSWRATNTRVNTSLRFAARTSIPFLVLLTALSPPFFSLASLLNIAGALSTSVTVIIPCLVALEILADRMGAAEKLACRVLVACSLTLAILTAAQFAL